MIKLIRRNQRVFLAGLTILSMLVFLVQRGSGGQGSDSDRVYGTINGKSVHTSEILQARAELQALQHSVRFAGRDGEPLSMLDLLFGREIAQAIEAKPEFFLMLTHEADAANVQVNRDEVQEIMVNQAKTLDPESEEYAAARAGVTDVYKILLRFQQVETAIKISKPMVDQALVRDSEALNLDVVQLNASDYISKVPPPTTQAVQEQFTAFASSLPKHPVPTTNPFGFGYKLPMRSKLQYLRVSPESLAAAVVATKSTYDWDVAARKYYLKNPQEFTKPATTQPTAPGTTAAASTQPAIQLTYDQATEQVLKTIRMPALTALMEQVRDYLTTTMNTDYQNYLQFCTANKPGEEPDSSLGVRYSSFSYIAKLTDAVKARFKVDIVGNETPEYLSTTQIGDMPGIGSSSLTDFVDKQAMGYLDLRAKNDPTAPAILMKPSGPIYGSEQQANIVGIVFARVSDVKPSAPPADIREVQQQVVEDVKLAAAYKLAQAEADAIQAAAKNANLAVAALIARKSVIPLKGDDAVTLSSNDFKVIYPPLADSAPSFTKQAFEMTAKFDPKSNPHPIQTIALPEQGRLFVVQLSDVRAEWDSETFYRTAMGAAAECSGELTQVLRPQWFNYDDVVKRVGFKATH